MGQLIDGFLKLSRTNKDDMRLEEIDIDAVRQAMTQPEGLAGTTRPEQKAAGRCVNYLLSGVHNSNIRLFLESSTP